MTTQWGYWCAGVVGIDAMGRFMHAMLGGMLVLVLPSFAVCVGISWMAWQRRDQFNGQ
jgi:hypothetical protein